MDNGYAFSIRDAQVFWPEAGPCVLLGGNNVGTAGEEVRIAAKLPGRRLAGNPAGITRRGLENSGDCAC
jgi:hypothetical protein